MIFETEASIWRGSLLEFRNRVAADSPTPGGGAVAAVTATFAAALLRMVCAIILKRTPDARMNVVVAEVNTCEEKLGCYADEDVRAFDRYIAARKDRKPSSQSKVQQCLLTCAEVPLQAAEQIAKLQKLASEIALNSPAFLASDIATARHLLYASRQALLANVAINFTDLENCEEKRLLSQRLEALIQKNDSTPQPPTPAKPQI